MQSSPSKLERAAARNLVTKYLRVRPGETTIIESWSHTITMASAMVDELRRVGGEVLFFYNDEDAWWRAYDRKQSKLLGTASATEWAALKAANVYVNFWGPGDTDRMEKMPDRPGNEAFASNWPWYATARKAGLRGLRMTEAFISEDRARKWGVNRAGWKESMERACLVDPEELAQRGARLSKAFSRGKRVRITHSNGTDLEVGLAAPPHTRLMDGRARPYRKGDSLSGMLHQAPAGTLDVTLDSQTAEGSFHANRRTNIWWNWHAGASLEFAGGKLRSYSLESGRKEFVRQFKRGTAGKDRTSLLKFGLNPAVQDVPNLETVEGGSVSLQIGGNRSLRGSNRSTFFTWFTLAGAEITVDGSPVVRAGKVL